MSASRQATIILKNTTNAILSRTAYSLDHGIWSADAVPPEIIGYGTLAGPSTGTWANESQGFMTGAQGTASYAMLDGTLITTTWDDPYIGSDESTVSISGPSAEKYKINKTEHDGNNYTVTFTLMAA